MKKIVAVILCGLALGVAYLLLWPVPIDPGVWQPPRPPEATGTLAVNERLAAGTRLCDDPLCVGLEDVSIGDDGLYGGTPHGQIIRISPDGEKVEVVAEVGGGKILGHDFAPDGRLIVCSTTEGLVSVDVHTGDVEVLATEEGGVPFRFTDDVDVASNGAIYFTDATSKFVDYELDFMEHRGNGRFMVYDPAVGKVGLLADNLVFANGVAIAPDESYVLVNETGKYRVHRYWLTGEKAGTMEIFAENLPGFPDGISSNGHGRYWVALFTTRNAQLDQMLPHPLLRKVVMRLPDAIKPKPQPYGYVLSLDENGNILETLQDPSPEAFYPATSVEEHDGSLFVGSLLDRGILRVSLQP